jgi:NhaP-type Na+/H+ or K+/H+ antiporter
MDTIPGRLAPFGKGGSAATVTAISLPRRPDAHRQTIIVATVFSIGLAVAVAVIIGIVTLRRRVHRRRAREEQRKVAAVQAVARARWGLGSDDDSP